MRRKQTKIPKSEEISTEYIKQKQIMTEFEDSFQNADDLINAFLNHVTTQVIESREFDAQKQLRISLPDHLHQHSSPRFSNYQQFIEEIRQSPLIVCNDQLFSRPLDQSQQLFREDRGQQSEGQIPIFNASTGERREKNSNAIKKIGRIILDNLRQYSSGRANSAVQGMLKLLSKDSKVGRTEVNKRDKFNTYHLRALLGGKDQRIIRQNLRTTHRILSRHLRRNVLLSRQITNVNKALYLNTMKCSALRCLHQSLAVRLQMSQ